MELYELIIEDENTDEVYALSLVENPAIEADWVYFTEHKELIKFATVDNDKRTIVAPVLIPDKRIYRVDERTGHEYEVFVTAETIEKLAQQYLMKGYQNKATVEHSENIDGDVTVVESWVSKSSTKDKSANYFTRMFPAGTWFVTMKVNDEKLWQDYVKTGKVKAISIEGLFGHQLVKAASIEHIMSKDINELTEDEALLVVSKIKSLLEAQPSIPNSSYPGQAASGSVAPELLGDVPPILQDFADCPPATQNIALNLYNRSIAIKQANYGPLNPNEPNEDYWKAKADQFGGSVEEAKSALCGNCAFFDLRKETLNCIAEGIGYEDDPEKAIEAGELGYCEAFDFKCAASRTCSAWVVGGPIKD
jgi:hypothetical protein